MFRTNAGLIEGCGEHLTVQISSSAAARLERYACRRGLSEADVASLLLQAVVRDDLYGAVLDRD
jgi:hypothetical protein